MQMLLDLMCGMHLVRRHLFDADQYEEWCQIARGAFSEVYNCSCCKEGIAPSQLAMKVSDLPSDSRQNEKAQVTSLTVSASVPAYCPCLLVSAYCLLLHLIASAYCC